MIGGSPADELGFIRDVGPRLLIHWLLRRSELCPGESLCPDSDDFTRCVGCKLNGLDAALSGEFGGLIARVSEIDAQLQWGGRFDLDDLPIDEFQALKILRYEREKLKPEDGQHPQS